MSKYFCIYYFVNLAPYSSETKPECFRDSAGPATFVLFISVTIGIDPSIFTAYLFNTLTVFSHSLASLWVPGLLPALSCMIHIFHTSLISVSFLTPEMCCLYWPIRSYFYPFRGTSAVMPLR